MFINVAPVSQRRSPSSSLTSSAASIPKLLRMRWIAAPTLPANGWHAHRLALGVAEGFAELGSDRTLWLETNARELNGVSFTKGCYVGQENTARMHHRSKVNRRLLVERHDYAPADARAWYPELRLAVVHRRVESVTTPLPYWIGQDGENDGERTAS